MDLWLGFVAVAAPVMVTPGRDTAVTIRYTLAGRRTGGIRIAFGVGAGQLGWPASRDRRTP